MNAGGHGLGLSICNKIAEGLNGNITIESQLGVGTTMTFFFPSSMETRQKFRLNPKNFLTKRNKNFRRRHLRGAINWKQDVGMKPIEESEQELINSSGNNEEVEEISGNNEEVEEIVLIPESVESNIEGEHEEVKEPERTHTHSSSRKRQSLALNERDLS